MYSADRALQVMIETNLLTFIWNIIDLILYLEIVRCAHILLI